MECFCMLMILVLASEELCSCRIPPLGSLTNSYHFVLSYMDHAGIRNRKSMRFFQYTCIAEYKDIALFSLKYLSLPCKAFAYVTRDLMTKLQTLPFLFSKDNKSQSISICALNKSRL
jgi:hypothetical protein